jgi:23S rRNA (cytosine1962-C5)-methyltransferase
MWSTDAWRDFRLLDCGSGEKLEQWGSYVLVRPDPQAIWDSPRTSPLWRTPHARYIRSSTGGGRWDNLTLPPAAVSAGWDIRYRNLTFRVKPMAFKHTGIFPEQAVNWDWMSELIASHSSENLHILNLFAYTGAATMACAAAGACEVVHVDAAKGMVQWAKDNMRLSHLEDHTIRFIVDDCLKFVEREKRRGHVYQGILMDPPSYGRGPNGEMWKFEKDIQPLLEAALELLDPDHPLFFLLNSYSAGVSQTTVHNMLATTIGVSHPEGILTSGEIGIRMQDRDMILPCGVYGRWQRHD